VVIRLTAVEQLARKEAAMSLIKRTPHVEMTLPSWLGGGPLIDWSTWPAFTAETQIKVEQFMDDGTLVVRAELPGIDPDKDVEITVTDHVLTITAERRREQKVEDKGSYRSEFEYGSFVRSMRLPANATEDDIVATYQDGILEVRAPMTEVAETRKVAVARS
jgi:HSP20 family protein